MGFLRVFSAIALTASVVQAQTYPTGSDPRNNLKPGKGNDAEVAAKGLKLVSFTGKPAQFDSASGLAFINSDLAFKGNIVVQGNFMGFMVWDVSNPAKPVNLATVVCQTSQGDPSIYGNLLFVSAEGAGNRDDCGKGGVKDNEPATAHFRGVRIFDISNPRAPKLVKNVETCKGSHTHTIIPSKTDKNIIYIYVSGSNPPRPEAELPGGGCVAKDDPADETNSRFRLDVIKVPLNKPADAAVVTGARIFTGLAPAQRAAGRGNGRGGRGGADTTPPPAVPPPSSQNCHDVTVYPEMNLLAGACGAYGLLVDISNPEKPVRLDGISDTTFSLWHTAVFSNDGKKVVFTDEWGGGTGPMCQATSMMQQGGNTTLVIGADKKYTQKGYFKLPSAQTAQENCVSHNGGILPIPGRDVMVQGWYQGGVDIIDFTDADKPVEIGYFDRGPVDPAPMVDVPGAPPAGGGGRGGRGGGSTTGGSWGAYYFNGHIYSSELARGFDVMELTPTENLSANEIAAAKLVRYVQYNPQSQPKLVWPAAFPVVRSYVDQLVRNQGLPAARTTAINAALDAAEKQSGAARKASLNALAAAVDKDVAGAKDSAKVQMLAQGIKDLAAATK